MRLIRKKIPAICLIVCMALAAVLMSYPKAEAAVRVDVSKKGTLTLALAESDSAKMGEDMLRIEEPIPVRIWKLADMLETGKYKFLEGFETLTMEGESWRQLSEDAFALVFGEEGSNGSLTEPKLDPAYVTQVRIGEGAAGPEIMDQDALSGLDLGLYLVVLDTVKSPKYEYSFTPMIVSLPWSEYQYVGDGGSDVWQYDREAVLKPAQIRRYGDIKIIKTLDTYNAAQGDVTFVFDVTAKDGDEVVYSNVVSATFSAAGTQELLVSHIPAEAIVTVREVYSGANCQIVVSDDEAKSVIAVDEAGAPVSFTFVNRYDEEAKRGYGIENRFRYNTEKNEYEWTTNRSDAIEGPGTEQE